MWRYILARVYGQRCREYLSNSKSTGNSKILPDWKSTKEQRVDWIADYEIPANKVFLDAVKTTNNIDNHMLKLGIFKKATNELIGWCCTGMKEELLHQTER